MLRDWIVREVKCEEFEMMRCNHEGELYGIGVTLLHILPKSHGQRAVDELDFFPICPMEQAFIVKFFQSTEDSMTNFIGQSVTSLLRRKTDASPSRKSEDEIYNFSVQSS